MSESRSTATHAVKSAPQTASSVKTGYEPEFLDSLLTHIPQSVLALDRDWRITYANAEARRISQIADADINSKTHWDLFPETIGTEVEQKYHHVMHTGEPAHVEFYYAPFKLWVEVHVHPTPDGITLYYRDVSDRKRAESLREASASQLRQVLDAAADSIVCIDRNWNCTFANPAARRILQADDLIGANLWTRFPHNHQEPFASNYRATMDHRIPTEFEAYYPEPLDIWFKVSVSPYEDGIIIFSNDITARKKAEARRDATSRELKQVFEATTDSVIILARDYTFTFLNPRAQELFAVKGDLIGRNLWEEFPAAETGSFFKSLHRAMDDRIPSEFEDFYPEPLNLWLNVQCRPSDDGIVVFFRDVTSEHTSRQILLDQQATLAFVQQTARVATWDMDLIKRTVKFSEGSYPVYGRPFSEITTIDDLDKIIRPSDLLHVQEDAKRAIDTGTISVVDYQVTTPQGGALWVECRRVPVYNSSGVATHLRGMTTDITARKRNEEELATSEERYRVLAELNPQAIWMGSADGAITYANQGFLDYIGLTLDDLDASTWLNSFAEDERERVLETWTQAVATGDEYDIETRMIRARDGAIRWWWLSALPVRDDAGNILHWLGVAMDIHDRKTAADQLRAEKEETDRQRAELETIYETAPVGLALFDPVDFRYLRVNDRQAETIGLPKDQILGRSIAEIAPLNGLKELFQRAATGHPVRNHLLEGELPTRPGEHRFWNVSYSPIYNSDGTVAVIAAVVLEMTNQKKAEAALIQSEKLAAVGRLASSISHEINNPLEAITNLLYLVSQSSLATESRTYIQLAQSELARVCQIATQTLRFHRQSVKATRIAPQDLVNAVLTLYQGRLANSGIRVEATYSATSTIVCFENDIRQVLNNLIANAIDAMRGGGGRLIVRAHDTTLTTPYHPEPRKGVRISIADTGHGMSPTVLARIFEPFYTTKDLNGTGLGLWISDSIVKRHFGHLSVRSTQHPDHHGTIFTLFLPAEIPID